MKREDPVSPEPLSGQRLGFELETASGVWLTDVWADLVVPAHGWLYVDRIESCNNGAASLLHALELGIASAARWIAVELLKDSRYEQYEEGVALYLDEHDPTRKDLHMNAGRVHERFGGVFKNGDWSCTLVRDRFPIPIVRASQEQAIAALIEHAAPWIATAIYDEVSGYDTSVLKLRHK